MITKRIIPCLDINAGRVVKGTRFTDLLDAGDPAELAKKYYEEDADELVFLDISASLQRRKTAITLASKVAKEIFIPFTIGGGINSIRDIEKILKAGADKIAINSAAVDNPGLIKKAAEEFGSQAIVLAIDAKRIGRRWIVCKLGGTKPTSLDAIEWAKMIGSLGAGEILLTSIDKDGTRNGFDLPLTKAVSSAVNIPVIASGGAGRKEDFLEVFTRTRASGALAASLFHYNKLRISGLKKYLKIKGVEIREC